MLRLSAFILALFLLTAGSAQAAPDIVTILIDDMGVSVIGPERRSAGVTPNIDALANGGTTYTQGYAAPACIPARTMLLSGFWPQRLGVTSNGPWPSGAMVTLAERLRASGYATAVVGKWHLGFGGDHHPLDQGFDQFFGFKGITPDYFGHDPEAPLFRNRTQIQNTGYVTDTLAAEAERILKAPRSKPLFLYVPLTAIHDPLQTTLEFAVQGADRAVGRIVQAAEPDTLFFFFGDNGRRYNPPLRGGKFSIYEGGVRAPFIIRWSGKVPPGRHVATPASLVDVASTALAAAGAPVPPLDGLNLLGAVPQDRRLFFAYGGTSAAAVRQGRWKLYLDYEIHGARLYDVLSDKGETTNVAAGNPEVVRTLTQAINAWRQSL